MDSKRTRIGRKKCVITEKILYHEVFVPPFLVTGKRMDGFTAGKRYPIYREVISDRIILEHLTRIDSLDAFVLTDHSVMYLTVNDYNEVVLKSAAYFRPNIECNITKEQ